MIVNLVFSAATHRGTAANRSAQPGEYSRPWPAEQCGDFFNSPSSYQWTGTALAAIDPAVLADERRTTDIAVVWENIKAERDARALLGGFKVEVAQGVYKWFHSDTFSRTQQIGLILAGANCPAVPWKTMDGTFVMMSQSLAQAIFAAAAVSDPAVYAAAEQHRAEMEASADPLSYDYSTGWPERYQDGL